MQKENTMTVGQWCGQWFIANRPKWNGNTGDGYRNLIYSHILPSIGSVVLSDLTEQTITDFYDSLQNRGLSARSVWCVHLLLRRCMDEAAREQFIPYNPVRLCQESKAEEYKAAPLRLGQLQRYLNAAEQLGVLPLIYTGLSSGLRQCELITLSWADFYARYRYILKGQRLLTLNAKAERLLKQIKAWRRRRRRSRHFCPQCGQFRTLEAGVFERQNKHRWRQLPRKAPCCRAFQGCLTAKRRN